MFYLVTLKAVTSGYTYTVVYSDEEKAKDLVQSIDPKMWSVFGPAPVHHLEIR